MLEVIAPVVFVTDVVLEPVTFFTVELLTLLPDVVLLTPHIRQLTWFHTALFLMKLLNLTFLLSPLFSFLK